MLCVIRLQIDYFHLLYIKLLCYFKFHYVFIWILNDLCLIYILYDIFYLCVIYILYDNMYVFIIIQQFNPSIYIYNSRVKWSFFITQHIQSDVQSNNMISYSVRISYPDRHFPVNTFSVSNYQTGPNSTLLSWHCICET